LDELAERGVRVAWAYDLPWRAIWLADEASARASAEEVHASLVEEIHDLLGEED